MKYCLMLEALYEIIHNRESKQCSGGVLMWHLWVLIVLGWDVYMFKEISSIFINR